MYCSNCGSKIPEGVSECPECKEKVENNSTVLQTTLPQSDPVNEEVKEEQKEETVSENNNIEETTSDVTVEVQTETNDTASAETISTPAIDEKDTGGPGSALLGFFLPPVGIIMYFLKRKEKPHNSKANLRGAIFGGSTYLAAYLVFILLVLPLLMPFKYQKNCEIQCGGKDTGKYEEESKYCRCNDGSVWQVEYK